MSHYAPDYSLLKLKPFLCLYYVMEGSKTLDRLLILTSKEVQEHRKMLLKAFKENKVILSPVRALGSLLSGFTCDPQIPRLTNSILSGVSET